MHHLVGGKFDRDRASGASGQRGIARRSSWCCKEVVMRQRLMEEPPAMAVAGRKWVVEVVVQDETRMLLEFACQVPADRLAIVDPDDVKHLISQTLKSKFRDQ